MSAHDNITLARHYIEDNLRQSRPAWSDECPESNGNAASATIQQFSAKLSDLRFTIHAIVAHGDEVEVFAASEASIPTPNSTQPSQRVRISERHILRIADGEVVAHKIDHAARIDIWDSREGWQPFTRPAATAVSAR